MARPPARGVALAVLAVSCWASGTVMSKAALGDFPAAPLLAVQLAASASALWFVTSLGRPPRAYVRRAWRLSWLGLLEPGAAYLIGLIGLADVEAGGATVIQASESIMIVVITALISRAMPSRRFTVLATLAFGGIVIATGGGEAGAHPAARLAGDALIAAETFIAACYVVLSGRVAAHGDPVTMAAAQHVVALALTLAALPLAWTETAAQARAALPPSAWGFAAASGVVQYALPFAFYLSAIRIIRPSLAGVFLNLIPVVGLAGGFLFLDETPSALALAGAGVTIGALILLSLTGGDGAQ